MHDRFGLRRRRNEEDEGDSGSAKCFHSNSLSKNWLCLSTLAMACGERNQAQVSVGGYRAVKSTSEINL